jgi:hypothetical protein
MNIEWIDKDFKDMAFNPFHVPMYLDMLEVWPMLKTYPEFDISPKPLNKNHVLRYIAYMYDKGSPIFRKIDNIHKQKLEAATLAGFKKKSAGTFSKHVDQMLVGDNHIVNHMIIRFLRLMRDESFMQFRVYKEKLYDSLSEMNETKDPRQVASLIAVNQSLTSVIDSIKIDFVGKANAKELIAVMYEQAEFEDLEITPELITERILQGLDPVEHYPYGENYKLDTYSGDDKSEKASNGSIRRSG